MWLAALSSSPSLRFETAEIRSLEDLSLSLKNTRII